ncbi:hypothetical protein ISN44_As10g015930 [Arabidopsis suecica]|uniref:Uncharacterized protein n=1 Tax=Arabidopsis suecica TaxID=45249 RepID=A0A8T1ZX93_ARASU|nr:hypothetical protein ISN44_As10g015930 [Arabidopsis suecica]KAG7564845.1 hypothetical protein ISN44_As10g015930 [Arabidopsis suecica]KAG7564846.1 hypothetical protein ISN44_As10g015930 [Arabidopsis suecica]KAG7564847.1 hypothetical protein ISN44_As10g015930 [Arabidopsis suecica]
MVGLLFLLVHLNVEPISLSTSGLSIGATATGGYQPYPPPSSRPYEGGYQGYFVVGGYPHHHHGPPPPPPPQNYNHCHHDHHHNHGSDSGCFSFIRGWFVFSTTSRLLIYFYQCFRLLSLLCVQ